MSLGIGIYEISVSLISTYVTCRNRFQIEKIFSQQHLFLILPKYQNITTTILIRSKYGIISSHSMDMHCLSLKKKWHGLFIYCQMSGLKFETWNLRYTTLSWYVIKQQKKSIFKEHVEWLDFFFWCKRFFTSRLNGSAWKPQL